ncbi:histone-arginine methyltransferase CARM1-like [Cervus canadensis]|uniref:histone-arginine methyltransferase CARM1-like n=1 Tax=Cervus canadensis TaxID=1574408 RepID=UPI001C9E6359|nr:histone-arginine methyltransferase CARM1-like [Cervus canadensis]
MVIPDFQRAKDAVLPCAIRRTRNIWLFWMLVVDQEYCHFLLYRLELVESMQLRPVQHYMLRYQGCCFGVSLSSLQGAAVEVYFSQPVVMAQSGLIHGLAFWFDVAFAGSRVRVWLSTAPTEPLTHWYQAWCLLQTPLLDKEGETLSGRVLFVANKQQSYDIQIMALVHQMGFRSGNTLSLKNPFFRFA